MKLVSLPYYKHLLTQYYKLPLITFLVCLGLGIAMDLSFGSNTIGILGPIGLVIMVVGLSIQMFTPLHRGLELSHLLSLPLSRKQIYTTTLLAGISLLLVPTLVLGFMVEYTVDYMVSYFFLMVYYFTLCCFSNLISKRTLTNLLCLLFLTVGIAMLSILNTVVVYLYSYGGSLDLDLSHLAAVIPVLSGIQYVSVGGWPYALCHLVEWLGMFGLSYVCFNRLKPEQASNTGLLVWVLKPFVYLVIFFLLMWLFSLSFYGYHFNHQYYLRFLLVMVVIGGVSAVLASMWLGVEGESLFEKKQVLQSMLYMGVSFALLLIPMRVDHHDPIEYIDINNKYYFNVVSIKENNDLFYQYIRNHPEQFKRDEGDLFITVFKDEGRDETYYMDLADMDDDFRQVLHQTIKGMPILPGEDVFVFQNEILNAQSYRDYIHSIQEKELPKNYIENISFSDYNDDHDYYAQALTSESFEGFVKGVKENVSVYLSQEELQDIYDLVEKQLMNKDVEIERTYYNDIKKGELTVAFDLNSNSDQHLEDHTLYDGYYYSVYYRVTLDDQKQVTNIELMEVF